MLLRERLLQVAKYPSSCREVMDRAPPQGGSRSPFWKLDLHVLFCYSPFTACRLGDDKCERVSTQRTPVGLPAVFST